MSYCERMALKESSDLMTLWLESQQRVAQLEAALDRIRRIHPEGLHKSAADAFYEAISIADAALQKPAI